MPPIICDVALGLMAALFSAMFFYFGRDGKKYHAKVKTDVETKQRLKAYFQLDFAFACIIKFAVKPLVLTMGI